MLELKSSSSVSDTLVQWVVLASYSSLVWSWAWITVCGVLHVPQISAWDTSGFPPKPYLQQPLFVKILLFTYPSLLGSWSPSLIWCQWVAGRVKGLVSQPNSGSLNPQRSDQQPKALTTEPPHPLKWGALENVSIDSAISRTLSKHSTVWANSTRKLW